MNKNISPKISIVTVVFNGEEFIEQTIQSVIKQKTPLVEYIIIDGASTDATVDIIKKYNNEIDYWVSEPDAGIYDAMNKAICMCNGEFISLVNADDFLMENALNSVLNMVNKNTDVLLTNGEFLSANGSYVYRSDISKLKYTMSIFHPGMIVSRKVYDLVGLYRTDLKIAADYDWIVRARDLNISWEMADFVYSTMREGGISSNYRLGSKELFLIQKTRTPVLAAFLYFLRLIKNFVKH